MLTITNMEKYYGTRKIGDFNNPKVISDDQMIFPLDSSLYWLGDSRKLFKIISKNHSKIKAVVIQDYFKKLDGSYKTTTMKRSSYVTMMKKEDTDKKITFVSNALSMGLSSMSTLLMYDFSMLKDRYKYNSSRSSSYDAPMNLLTTMVDGLVEPNKLSGRNNIFIPIYIPNKMPSFADIKKYRKRRNHRALDALGKDAIGVIELCNYIMDDTSVFNKVKDPHEVFIIFYIGNKITISRLSNIKALNKSNEIAGSTIKGVSANSALLKFIMYLVKISLTTARDVELLKNEAVTDVRGFSNDVSEVTEDMIEELIAMHNDNMDTFKEPAPIITSNTLSLKEEYDHEEPVISVIEKVLETKQSDGIVSENIAKKLLEKAVDSEKIMEEMATNNEEITVDEKYRDSDFVVDKELLSATNEAMTKKYITEVYPKNVKSMIYALSKSGNVVVNHTVNENKNVASETTEHVIEIMGDKGKTSTLKLYVPTVREDGTMLQNGNTYIMRRQESEIPIMKVNASRVALSSYYSKLFINKAEVNTNNMSASIHKQLSKNDKVSILVKGDSLIYGEKIPDLYMIMARTIKSFNFNGIFFSFDFNNIKKTFNNYTGKNIPIGKKGKDVYTLDDEGNVYKNDTKLSHLFEYFEINERKLAVEHANLQIMGERIPMALILIYYYGLKDLLIKLDVTHRFESNLKTMQPNEYNIHFADGHLILDRRNVMHRLIFGGLSRIKMLRGIDKDDLNNKDGILTLFHSMSMPKRLTKELDLLDVLWVDPVTKDILKLIKEPVTFRALLFRAVELLSTEYANKSSHITNKVFKGYDRLAGMMYKVLSTKIREHEHKLGKVTTKISINPYDVMSMLTQDSTYSILDDLNPLASIKHKEEITMTGAFGRDRMAISETDRTYSASAIGVVSEATKDSKDVGVTTFLSSAPNIKNVYGVITDIPDTDDLTNANIYSLVSNLMPLSDKDDGKRMLTSNIMASHMVPTVGQKVFPINRGYEAMIPYKVGPQYVRYAEENGKVIKLNKKYVEVEYASGKVKYPLNRWTTKEIGGLTYTHTNVTMLLEGDKIKPYDIITYDSLFFGPNSQVKNTILYKGGQLARVMLDDTDETYEDSFAITERFARESATKLTDVRTKVLTSNTEIISFKSIGDKVTFHDSLIHFDKHRVTEFKELENISNDSLEIIKGAKENTLKAESSGVITNIVIYYNCDLEDITSDALIKMIKNSDDKLKLSKGYTGQVDSTFSEFGKPLKEGEIIVKYYIEKEYAMIYGDKSVASLQLKATVGEVVEDIVTEDGDYIDMKFGSLSVAARIVESPFELGSSYEVLNAANKKVVELYNK